MRPTSASAYPFAVPSFVLPGTVAENAEFLAHKVQEVGLYFMEAKACLAYTEVDLPASLRALPLRWHVHLPVDLVWSRRQGGGAHAAKMALAVLEKAAYLHPRMAVLHPPTFTQDVAEQEKLLQEFFATWQTHSTVPVLLENILGAPLYDLDTALFHGVVQQGAGEKRKKASKMQKTPLQAFGVCLDVGHMLAFGQEEILQRQDLLDRVAMVHWSAPGTHDQHLPLTHFTSEQKLRIQSLIPLLPATATHVVEVFHWQGICESVEFLRHTLERRHACKN